MPAPSPAVVCRTVVVLAYLLALAAAGRSGWATVSAGVALITVWLIPVVLHHGRDQAQEGAAAPAAGVRAGEAPAG